MRIAALIGACLMTGTLGGVAGASVLLGPEGNFSTFLGRLEYDPSTACHKPFRPYSNDRSANREYIEEAEEYLRCMQNAAQSDAKYANEVIADGLQEKSDAFVSEVESGH